MHIFFIVFFVLISSLGLTNAIAQNYPSKSVRFLVGFPPGGTNDIVARLLGQKMTEITGQQFIIENRGGANTAIATELASRAVPDGYTIVLNAPGHATNPALMKLAFDSIKDFSFITLVAEAQNLAVVHPSFPPRNIKELILFAQKHPGQINYGSSGNGSTVHLSGELLQYMTKIKMVHIPYKGAGPALVDLLAGQHVLYFGNMPSVIQHARNGKLRPIAVTGSKRAATIPEIPTIAESGVPGYEVTAWFGVAVPSKTPRVIVEKLNGDMVRAINTPDFRKNLQSQGADPVGNSPEQYLLFIQNETDKWAKVIKSAGIKVE
jgi:tripartite-type tricarboxylate transporter receptor subunit TctC